MHIVHIIASFASGIPFFDVFSWLSVFRLLMKVVWFPRHALPSLVVARFLSPGELPPFAPHVRSRGRLCAPFPPSRRLQVFGHGLRTRSQGSSFPLYVYHHTIRTVHTGLVAAMCAYARYVLLRPVLPFLLLYLFAWPTLKLVYLFFWFTCFFALFFLLYPLSPVRYDTFARFILKLLGLYFWFSCFFARFFPALPFVRCTM